MKATVNKQSELFGLRLTTAIVFAIQFTSFLLFVTPNDVFHPTVLTSVTVGTLAVLLTFLLLPFVLGLTILLLLISRDRSLVGLISICGIGFEVAQLATMLIVNNLI